MIKNIAIVLAVAIVAALLFAASKPDTFAVERAAVIKAPPEKIFALINDFQQWRVWSPYENLDPAMRREYLGAAAGTGAIYTWDGDKKAGQGRMEITASEPFARIAINLDFVRPMESHNTVEFTLAANGDTTAVIWAMRGPQPYIAKVMQLFFNMDKMVGGDFETGLANLKRIAEQ